MSSIDPNTLMVLVTMIATGVAAFVTLWSRTQVRPTILQADHAISELSHEPPALVDMLTGGFEVGDSAVAATLVDLVARGFITVEGTGADLALRALPTPNGTELLRFEQRVLERIAHLGAASGVVPALALTTGNKAISQRWWKGFVREVTSYGRDLGVCRRRWTFAALVPVWGSVGLAWALAWLTFQTAGRSTDPMAWGDPIVVTFTLTGVALFGLIFGARSATRGDAQRDTELGRERALHWLGVRKWMENGGYETRPAEDVTTTGRALAYATALDLAPKVVARFPFAGEHDRRAWSDYAGPWRQVRIRYTGSLPGWGSSSIESALMGAGRVVIFGIWAAASFAFATLDQPLVSDLTVTRESNTRLFFLLMFAALVPAVLYNVVRCVVGLFSLGAGTTWVEGRVLRNRRFEEGQRFGRTVHILWRILQQGSDRQERERRRRQRIQYWAAIDDGTTDVITAFRLKNEGQLRQLREGYVVRLQVTRLLGHVKEIEIVDRSGRDVVAPVIHELADRGISRAQIAVAQRTDAMAAGIDRSLQMTDEHGKPLLDLTELGHEDGQSLAEQLAHARQQVHRAGLRHNLRRADGTSVAEDVFNSLLGPLERLAEATGEATEATPTDTPPPPQT